MSVEENQSPPQERDFKHIQNSLQNDPVTSDDREQVVRFLQSQQQKLAGLEEKLRKQEYDFTTVMEMTNQIIARSVDSSGLEEFISYIHSTLQGHFGVRDVHTIYRKDVDGARLSPPGHNSIDFTLHSDSQLANYLSDRNDPVSLKDLYSDIGDVPELQKLSDLNVELVLGLNRRMNTNQSHLQGILFLGPKIVEESYTDANKQFLSLLGRMIAISLHNAALYQKSIHDSLTGLYTRGHFDYQLKEQIDALTDSGPENVQPLSVIILDLDHFKQFNDQYGHQTGDEILRSVSKTLCRNTRPEDLLARYGGEEFIVSAPDTDRKDGKMIAERLRKKVKEMSISIDGYKLDITLSAGISTFPSNSRDPKALIAKADDALYKAKENGRDCVVVAHQNDNTS